MKFEKVFILRAISNEINIFCVCWCDERSTVYGESSPNLNSHLQMCLRNVIRQTRLVWSYFNKKTKGPLNKIYYGKNGQKFDKYLIVNKNLKIN